MEHRNVDDIPPDLQDVANRLTANRPVPEDGALERVKARVEAACAPANSTRTKRGTTPMKPRIAIAVALTLGLAMTGSGAGLAVSGISSDGSAAISQYGPDNGGGGGTGGGQPPDNGSGGGGDAPTIGTPTADTDPGTAEIAQVESLSQDSDLPFTGFPALAVMIGGILLVVCGLVLRFQTRRAS